MDATLALKLARIYRYPNKRLQVLIISSVWVLALIVMGAVILGRWAHDLPLLSDVAIAIVMLILSAPGVHFWTEYLRLDPLFGQASDQSVIERLSAEYWSALRIVWITSIPSAWLFAALAAAGKALHALAAR